MNLLLGKKNDTVETPDDFYNELYEEFEFDFDPCPIDPKFDGLEIEWGMSNYVNPPFSEVDKWASKAVKEIERSGCLVVMLTTVRTDTNYWREIIYPIMIEVRFINKITFPGFKKPFPIPLCIVIMGPLSRKNNLTYKKTYSFF